MWRAIISSSLVAIVHAATRLATLLMRVLESVFLRHAVGVAWPWWDVLLLLIGVGAVVGAFMMAQAEKPKSA